MRRAGSYSIKRITSLQVLVFAVLLVLAGKEASALDYPHFGVNNIGCDSCHFIYGTEPTLLPPWTAHTPQNIDDTQHNTLCWSCHNDVDAPYVRTHSSLQIDDSYGDWTVECRVCHNPHYQKQKEYGSSSYLYSGVSTAVTATTITKTGAGWTADAYEGMVAIPNISQNKYIYQVTDNTEDTLTVEGPMDLTKLTTGNTFAVLYGNLINKTIDMSKITITPAKSGSKTTRFFRTTGSKSFADGDATYDGVCEVCHTQTTHFRNNGSGSNQLHTNVGSPAGTNCTTCHSHVYGFRHGGGEGTGCDDCHGHDAGYGGATGGKGTYVAHSAHTENDSDDLRGPNVGCSTCHNTSSFPNFADGVSYADYKSGAQMTTVCNPCHSPSGTYNGVSDAAVGAKNNWSVSTISASRVYESDGSLRAGKEKWCATCHDESPSQIQSVNAPNVVGAEDGSFTYGTGWGFYKTGHGLSSSLTYPESGGVVSGAGKGCLDCHLSTTTHIDGDARTFNDDNSTTNQSSEYRIGYRLQQIGGQEPMQMPMTIDNINNTYYRLCMQTGCHPDNGTGPFLDGSNLNTNMRNGATNLHNYHLDFNNQEYSSDWDFGGNVSQPTCVTCHNVHGSKRLAMLRDGALTGVADGFEIWYYNPDIVISGNPPSPDDLPLSASTGTIYQRTSPRDFCAASCHGGTIATTSRSPFQNVSQVPTLDWTGETNYTADGVNPNSGNSGSNFVFRVKYTDTNNDAPTYIQVWVDRNDDGDYLDAEEEVNMTAANPVDTNYTDGKFYTKTLTLTSAGDNTFNYRFYAANGSEATGSPTSDRTISITNSAPTLTWTGELYYVSDGVNPDTGGSGSSFEFRVKYNDSDNTAPSSIQVWVDTDESGTYEPGEKYTMTGINAGDTTYTDGKLYTKSLTIAYSGDGSFNYRFYASDGTADATGSPTSNSSLTVSSSANNPPYLDWVAETCRTNSVKPATGPDGGDFEFLIKYTDKDNQCPPAASDMQVWVDANDNSAYESGEKYNLTEVDASDTTCSDGKLYKTTKAISLAGDNVLNYRFYASDGTDTAGGDPISDSAVTVVNALKVRPSGGSGWYSTIQSAIDAIDGAHTVLVYEGTYNVGTYLYFNGANDNNTNVKSVCGADSTILSGSGTVVYFLANSGSTLDGFQVTGGNYGVFLNGSSPTITNSKIHGISGRGIDTGNSGSTLTLSNSEVYSNTDRGIYINGGSGHAITNSIIRDNSSGFGGGVYILGAAVTFTDTTIKNNTATGYGGGVNSNGAPLEFYRCTITGNIASGRSGAIELGNAGASAYLENSIIADNQGDYGGASFVNGGSYTAINSTFANNRATGTNGGAISNNSGTVIVRNSIFWNNMANTVGHIAYLNGGSMVISDSIMNNDGDGDFTDVPYFYNGSPTVSGYTSENDPVFVSESGGDYHIQSSSNAIDNASATYAPANDIDGDSRPQGSADDIGADEYDGTINNAPALLWTGEANYESDGVNPNTAIGGSSFEFRINYTDADNNAPTSIQVWVDRNDNGTYESSEKYDMSAVNVDNTYSDGKLYSKTLTLLYAGNGVFNYRFYASDGTVDAAGTPTSDNTVTVINNTPALAWTGETNYISDGANPDSGLSGSNFEFRVDYADTDNTTPSYIEVWVDEDDSGVYDLDEKYSMTETDGDTDYTDGKWYSKTLTVASAGDGILNYKFASSDGTDSATGAPTNDSSITVSGVTVTFTSVSQATIDESGTATITAQLSAVSGQDVTVPFTVRGSSMATGGGTDYSIIASPIVITAGNTTADITVTITTDTLDENDETVIVDMGTPTNAAQGAITTHTLTITDDDPTPTVTFTSASQSTAGESGTATITAQLSAASGKNVTVPFTVNGSSTATGSGTDYSITASPITITAGNTSADITVTISADSLDENNETVIVDMGTPTNATQGATTTHTVTITDDDATPTVTFTSASQATANESGTPTITAQLSAISGRNVTVPFTVNGSSTAIGGGVDYSITASPITITAGNTTADITVTIAADSIDENNETVIVDMGTPTNATQGAITTHTLTITDDDEAGGGTTYTVCKVTHADNPCDYQTINAGIDSAAVLNEDTLLVSADTYSENINFDGKNITIISKTGAVSTTITGSGANAAVVTFSTSENANAVLDGFTINNQAANTATRGIYISGAAPTIKNSIIEGNSANNGTNGGGGVYVDNSIPTFDNCTIRSNTATNRLGGGIYITGAASGATIANSTIGGSGYANSANSGGGIYFTGSTTGTLSISGSTIAYNTTTQAGTGIYITGITNTTTFTNTSINNNTSSQTAGGIYTNNSALSFTDCNINNNATGSTASYDGGGIYLTGASASATISGGTVSGNSGRYGGGIFITGSTAATPLSISNATMSSNTGYLGGAAYLTGVTNTVSITGTTISGNTGIASAGGIYNNAVTFEITNSHIDSNIVSNSSQRGGGLYLTGAKTTTITDTTVDGNTTTGLGGGIYAGGGATLIFTGGSINSNTTSSTGDGGGIAVDGVTTLSVSKANIRGNKARYGGGIYYTSTSATAASITNCTITGNTHTGTLDGGGIYTSGTAMDIINSTLAGNYAYRYGGGIRVQAGTVNVKNSIIYGNTAGTSGPQISGTPIVTYSNIEGGFAGTGNINSDPLFISFTAGDKAANNDPKTSGNFHIQSGSLCKDAGNNADAPAGTDIDGDTRIISGTVDMGSDEYVP